MRLATNVRDYFSFMVTKKRQLLWRSKKYWKWSQKFLSSRSGNVTQNTMTSLGDFEGLAIIVFVDTGSPHNFISETVAKYLNPPIYDASLIKVQVASRQPMDSQGKCTAI